MPSIKIYVCEGSLVVPLHIWVNDDFPAILGASGGAVHRMVGHNPLSWRIVRRYPTSATTTVLCGVDPPQFNHYVDLSVSS
jgi:hypothetical protein